MGSPGYGPMKGLRPSEEDKAIPECSLHHGRTQQEGSPLQARKWTHSPCVKAGALILGSQNSEKQIPIVQATQFMVSSKALRAD